MKILNVRNKLDNKFIDLLCNYQNHIKNLNIKLNDCCIVGSSVLNALNIRPADDIDFTLKKEIRDKHFDNGVTILDQFTDVVTYNYPREFSDKKTAITDDQLINKPSNHFYIRGMKFAHPDIVLTRKQCQRRDKDLNDVKLLSDFIYKNLY